MNNIKEFNLSNDTENEYLWKFISIEKFLSIILNRKLYFTRIDCFEDLQEGISPELLLLNHLKKNLITQFPFAQLDSIHSIDLFPKETDGLIDELKEMQMHNFANCWYLCNDNIESVAMWNLYSQPNSVALNIKYTDFHSELLKNSFKSDAPLKTLTLGKIKYVNFQDPYVLDKVKAEIENTTFWKDQSFAHESEFRLVAEIEKYDLKPFSHKEGLSVYKQKEFYDKTSQIYGFNIRLNNFFNYSFEIVFHPKISSWMKSDLKLILDKFEIPFKTRDSNLKIR